MPGEEPGVFVAPAVASFETGPPTNGDLLVPLMHIVIKNHQSGAGSATLMGGCVRSSTWHVLYSWPGELGTAAHGSPLPPVSPQALRLRSEGTRETILS